VGPALRDLLTGNRLTEGAPSDRCLRQRSIPHDDLLTRRESAVLSQGLQSGLAGVWSIGQGRRPHLRRLHRPG
jgi:hypothetical protein